MGSGNCPLIAFAHDETIKNHHRLFTSLSLARLSMYPAIRIQMHFNNKLRFSHEVFTCISLLYIAAIKLSNSLASRPPFSVLFSSP